MRHPVVGFTLALGLSLTVLSSTFGAENAGLGSLNPSLMSAEGLEAKIARAEASTDLDPEIKTKIVARYREALNNLKEAEVNRDRAAAFEEVAQAAPEETRRVRERVPQAGAPDSRHRGSASVRRRRAARSRCACARPKPTSPRQRRGAPISIASAPSTRTDRP